MSERDKPFTINDRRHFTPEGQAREDAEAPPVAAPPLGPSQPEDPASPAIDAGGAAAAPGPIDFSQFLLSLGAQAGMLLSPGEASGAAGAEALEGARQIISILEMLKDKTEGRRTGEESGILDNLLFQLRLAYVERARRP